MKPLELSFKSFDGAEISYRAWLPDRPAKHALLLFHRGHEHSGRWQETVEKLKLEDFAIFAWDQRGHGRSSGARGDAENVAVITKDVDLFARHVLAEHGIEMQNTVVIGHSVGAVIAAAWVHDFAPRIRALILAAPALRVKLYVPLAIPFLRALSRVRKNANVKSYVRSKMLTRDSAQAAAYDADPLIFRNISLRILLDLHDTATRLINDAAAITVPMLMLASEKDWVVKLDAQQKFFRNLGSPIKQLEMLRGFQHAIFHEADRQIVFDRIRSFIRDSFTRPWQHDGLLEADNGGFTRSEYDLLRMPKRGRWSVIRLAMRTACRLSDGVRLGWKSGFDSGTTLDYVYRNRSRGLTPIGRCIDWFYLNSAGWRAIRQRRRNLEAALRHCISETHREGREVRILDIASGPGRYVLETMNAVRDIPTSAMLRDYKEVNLEEARRLSRELGVANVAVAQGDAFDREDLARISPRPTIAVVSGLYELFPDNQRILQSLRGLADAMDEGGYLIYTNQPWHPQLEFIARVLVNREGEPWIMRRRTQAEMDELARAAGFEKISQQIDPWGMLTVSIARRAR